MDLSLRGELESLLDNGRQHHFDAITAAAHIASLSDNALFLLMCEEADDDDLRALQVAALDELRMRGRERHEPHPMPPAGP